MKIKSPPKTGHQYIDDCFQFDYEEFSDSRTWSNLPKLREIPLLAETNKEEALSIAEAALKENDDSSFLYFWIAKLRGELGYPDEPMKTYLEGLQKGRKKPMLCGALAMLWYQNNNLEEAVKWWIRSCAIQFGCGLSNDSFSILNLAYIAGGLQMPEYKKLLYEKVQALQRIDFNSEGIAQRYQLAFSQGNPFIKMAIKLLCDFYIKK